MCTSLFFAGDYFTILHDLEVILFCEDMMILMKIPELNSADIYNPKRQKRMSKFDRKAHMEKPSSKQTEKPIITTL
jgi:hypothetical protein